VRDPRAHTPANEMRLRDQARDTSLPSRRSLSLAGLDTFWPILAAILVAAVIFVASVAHSSMDDVGIPVLQNNLQAPKPTTKAGPILIVQISSHPTRSVALAAAKDLKSRGIAARVLKSDNYRPLKRGYFVVFTGPYPTAAAGRSEAKKVQAKLAGALLREIQRREDSP
jgi:hypothetical protein